MNTGIYLPSHHSW